MQLDDEIEVKRMFYMDIYVSEVELDSCARHCLAHPFS